MAVTYVWPGSLPQSVRPDYSEEGGVRMLRTPMSAGVAKMRRIGRRPTPLSVSMLMTDAQVQTLETFVQTTLRGTSRFRFQHPRTREQVEVRLVPSDDGKLYNLAYVSRNVWQVSMSLEVLP